MLTYIGYHVKDLSGENGLNIFISKYCLMLLQTSNIIDVHYNLEFVIYSNFLIWIYMPLYLYLRASLTMLNKL